MEMELNTLIDKIKKDGLEKADKESARILKEAKNEAASIMKGAEQEKERLIGEAEKSIKDSEKASREALKQAARDVLLTLRGRVTEFFDRIIKDKTSETMETKFVADAIAQAVKNFTKENELDIEVLVNEKERDALEKSLFQSLKTASKKQLELKGSRNVEKGFRIGEKGKNSYFDFTEEAVSEAFAKYLNPKLVEKLNIGLGLEKENA